MKNSEKNENIERMIRHFKEHLRTNFLYSKDKIKYENYIMVLQYLKKRCKK